MPDRRRTKLRPSPAHLCPVARLALEWGRLWEQYNALDELSSETPADKAAICETQMDMVWHRKEAVFQQISAMPARSLPGAMAHTIIAQRLLDDLTDEGDDNSRELIKLRLTACLYSILAVLEKTSGFDAKALGAQPVLPDYLNPFGAGFDYVAACKRLIEGEREGVGKAKAA